MKIKINAKLLFNLISPIYGLFYERQERHYISAIDNIKNELDFSAYENVIDIGCGTGALCSALHERGLAVTGIDPAQGMLNIAVKKHNNNNIECIKASVLKGLPFEDKSFDISIASYVAHGLNEHERKIMYAEMSRVSKHFVILYDYNTKRNIIIDIIEWLERGDYFNFVKQAKDEMETCFKEVKEINVVSHASWYICKPSI